MDTEAGWATVQKGHKELDTIEQLSTQEGMYNNQQSRIEGTISRQNDTIKRLIIMELIFMEA